jgi:predicted membrane GTPase involved in stress response|tara:strand:+ start:816 stop:1361 length:546 start_codon:yes stop_codon:yes gene_type:complete
MSCDISRGRLEPCKDSVGGLNAVYFINKGDIVFTGANAVAYNVTDTDVIDTLGSAVAAYKFDIKGASAYTENITSSRENGTTTFEQVLELQLTKLTKEDHKTVKMLAYGSPTLLVEDNNGNVFVAGLEHGLDVSGGTIVSGASMGDMSGYTLTFTGMERVPANFLDAGDIAGAGVTVTVGV